MQHRMDHYPSELSGENRKILYQGYINNQIILADEPTGSLDHKNARWFLKYFWV